MAANNGDGTSQAAGRPAARKEAISRITRYTLIIALAVVTVAIGGLAVMYDGLYDVAATQQHSAVTAWALHTTALRSINAHARTVEPPRVFTESMALQGLKLFHQDCVQCHGAPGEAPKDFAMGLLPSPPRLGPVGREWRAGNIFWVIKNGIKMTGMPAWAFRMDDQDIWALVAFIQKLPDLSPATYREMTDHIGAGTITTSDETSASGVTEPDANRGKTAIAQYGCTSCHNVPGLPGPPANVGPTLAGMRQRMFIAGLLANTPANMRLWIRDPQKIKPNDEMPDMGVTARDAADIALYVESLK